MCPSIYGGGHYLALYARADPCGRRGMAEVIGDNRGRPIMTDNPEINDGDVAPMTPAAKAQALARIGNRCYGSNNRPCARRARRLLNLVVPARAT